MSSPNKSSSPVPSTSASSSACSLITNSPPVLPTKVRPVGLTAFGLDMTVSDIVAAAEAHELHLIGYSPTFSFHFLQWSLSLARMGSGSRRALCLLVMCENPGRKGNGSWQCTADCKITFVKGGEPVGGEDVFCVKNNDVTFSSKKDFFSTNIVKFSELLKKKNGFLNEDNSIQLRVDISPKSIVGVHYELKSGLIEELKTKPMKVLQFLEKGIGCDVTFLTKDDEEVKAHKFILMEESPVFKTMFEVGLSESKRGEIEVEDIDSDTLTKFLTLMYTNDPTPIDTYSPRVIKKLLYAAEKYELDWIKSYCGYVLSECCNVETAPYLHKLAKRFRLEQVEKEVTDFATANYKFEEVWDQLTAHVASDDDSD